MPAARSARLRGRLVSSEDTSPSSGGGREGGREPLLLSLDGGKVGRGQQRASVHDLNF